MFKSKSRSYFLCRLCKQFQCTNRLCHSCPSSRWVKLWNLMDEVRLTFFLMFQKEFACTYVRTFIHFYSNICEGKVEIWNETFFWILSLQKCWWITEYFSITHFQMHFHFLTTVFNKKGLSCYACNLALTSTWYLFKISLWLKNSK